VNERVVTTSPAKRAKEIAELASDRRVVARRLPMDFTLAGAMATCLFFAPEVPGLWLLFGLGALWAVGGFLTLLTTTRKLAGTLPEERGKRSDDKALAKAQNTLGCLGFLLMGTACAAILFHASRGTWPWQPWVVALGGIVGQISGIAAIAWSRRSSVSSAHDRGPEACDGPSGEHP
jgi:hypothetical protein